MSDNAPLYDPDDAAFLCGGQPTPEAVEAAYRESQPVPSLLAELKDPAPPAEPRPIDKTLAIPGGSVSLKTSDSIMCPSWWLHCFVSGGDFVPRPNDEDLPVLAMIDNGIRVCTAALKHLCTKREQAFAELGQRPAPEETA